VLHLLGHCLQADAKRFGIKFNGGLQIADRHTDVVDAYNA
jgi:hypothetical protein